MHFIYARTPQGVRLYVNRGHITTVTEYGPCCVLFELINGTQAKYYTEREGLSAIDSLWEYHRIDLRGDKIRAEEIL